METDDFRMTLFFIDLYLFLAVKTRFQMTVIVPVFTKGTKKHHIYEVTNTPHYRNKIETKN